MLRAFQSTPSGSASSSRSTGMPSRTGKSHCPSDLTKPASNFSVTSRPVRSRSVPSVRSASIRDTCSGEATARAWPVSGQHKRVSISAAIMKFSVFPRDGIFGKPSCVTELFSHGGQPDFESTAARARSSKRSTPPHLSAAGTRMWRALGVTIVILRSDVRRQVHFARKAACLDAVFSFTPHGEFAGGRPTTGNEIVVGSVPSGADDFRCRSFFQLL